jgi:hypothetical protein
LSEELQIRLVAFAQYVEAMHCLRLFLAFIERCFHALDIVSCGCELAGLEIFGGSLQPRQAQKLQWLRA